MASKKLIQEFYKSDALINSAILESYLHPEFLLEWNSSKGFITLNHDTILNYVNDLGKSYIRSKVTIHQILQEGNFISVRYSHFIKTFENPREEIHLANFFAIWEIKEGKLFRGYQMSQLV